MSRPDPTSSDLASIFGSMQPASTNAPLNPSVASLSSLQPPGTETGLTPPPFNPNAFSFNLTNNNPLSTSPAGMNSLPRTGFTPLASGVAATPATAAAAAALVAATQATNNPYAMSAARALPPPQVPITGTVGDFRNNIQVVLTEYLPRLDQLSRLVIEGIEKAYHPQVDPNRTAQDVALLITATQLLYDYLKESHVGALPLVDLPPLNINEDGMQIDPPSEPPIIPDGEEVTKRMDATVNSQYAKQKRLRDSAQVVVNLLNKPT